MNPTVARAYELVQSGKAEQAEAMLRRLVSGASPDPQAAFVMSRALRQLGRLEQALHFAGVARKGMPGSVDAILNFAAAALMAGKHEEAARAYADGLAIEPGHPDVINGVAICAAEAGEFERAREIFDRALAEHPKHLGLHVSYAKLLDEMGRSAECFAFLREASTRFPWELDFKLRAAFAGVAQADVSAGRLFALHKAVGEEIEKATPAYSEWPGCVFDAERGLRVGFLSPDLRSHSVAYFFEPLLEHLPRGAFATTCYSTTDRTDDVTARLKKRAGAWRDCRAMGDIEIAEKVRADRIDVLVDLAGLSFGGRIGVPARRPAPVQVTYLGYPFSTGLSRVDVRLVDAITDPPGSEALASERLVRLAECFLCYRPGAPMPEVAARGEDGPIVFGSFNALHKVSESCVALWARVVNAVPGSRLLLKGRAFASESGRQWFTERFTRTGLDPARVDLMERTPQDEHLASYGRMDVALDPMPYNGTTTTCEALLMGVPVVTLAGAHHAARVGASILNAVGLPELVAADEDGYVEIARRLAADRARLAVLRSELRARLLGSALCDEVGFAGRFGGAVRGVWRERCGQS